MGTRSSVVVKTLCYKYAASRLGGVNEFFSIQLVIWTFRHSPRGMRRNRVCIRNSFSFCVLYSLCEMCPLLFV
jgi:hypothetical protein